MLSSEEIKILFDIGLGAVSLMLWFRQGKVNRAQQEIDAKQNKNCEDLTIMVRGHEDRLQLLESIPIGRYINARRAGRAAKQRKA